MNALPKWVRDLLTSFNAAGRLVKVDDDGKLPSLDGSKLTGIAPTTSLLVPKTTTVNGHPLSGNVTVTAADVGLDSVDNTADTDKPVSTAMQTALNTKADLSSIALPSSSAAAALAFGGTSTVGVSTSYARGDHVHGLPVPDYSGLVPATTTVNGHALSSNIAITKGDVDLGNVDNTSDLSKPISTATAAALASKADLVDGTVPAAQLPPGLTLGETISTAYRGDRGAIAFTHSQTAHVPLDAPTFTSSVTAPYFVSTVATGTAPFTVTSATVVANLNADRLDGFHASQIGAASSVVATDASGNTGLGAAAPTGTKLHVRGGGQKILQVTDGTTFTLGAGLSPSAAAAAVGWFGGTTNTYLALGSNALEHARFTLDGNFLVGATADDGSGAKVQVAGAVKATSFLETVYNGGTTSGNVTLSLANGTFQKFTVGGAHQFTMPAAAAGASFTLRLVGAGSVPTFAGVTNWLGTAAKGTAPTLSTAAGNVNILAFWSDGTIWEGLLAGTGV